MSRQHENIVEIKAPADVVWRAITEAEEIQRWFAPEVRVEPGVGGSMWVSFGPGMEGTMKWGRRRRSHASHLRRLRAGDAGGQHRSASDPFRIWRDRRLGQRVRGHPTRLGDVPADSQAWARAASGRKLPPGDDVRGYVFDVRGGVAAADEQGRTAGGRRHDGDCAGAEV
jgi:Activator of Hsp90 ATPase homolog 1-like protein